MGLESIFKGHLNEFLGLNKSLSGARMDICIKCPLYRITNIAGIKTPVCATIWLNPKTNEISIKESEGFFKGCGCRLQAKTTVENEKCPAGKW